MFTRAFLSTFSGYAIPSRFPIFFWVDFLFEKSTLTVYFSFLIISRARAREMPTGGDVRRVATEWKIPRGGCETGRRIGGVSGASRKRHVANVVSRSRPDLERRGSHFAAMLWRANGATSSACSKTLENQTHLAVASTFTLSPAISPQEARQTFAR